MVTHAQIKRARAIAREKDHRVLSSRFTTPDITRRSFLVTSQTRQVGRIVRFTDAGFQCEEACEAFHYTHVCAHIGCVLNLLHALFHTQAQWDAFLKQSAPLVPRAEKPLLRRESQAGVDPVYGVPLWALR
jgi:hypothetical protein